jgi:hypothetical protein
MEQDKAHQKQQPEDCPQKTGSLQPTHTQTPVVIGPQTSWSDRVRHALTYQQLPK